METAWPFLQYTITPLDHRFTAPHARLRAASGPATAAIPSGFGYFGLALILALALSWAISASNRLALALSTEACLAWPALYWVSAHFSCSLAIVTAASRTASRSLSVVHNSSSALVTRVLS